MYLSFVKLAAAPLCFIYLKSSDRWHSDIAAAGKPGCTAYHEYWAALAPHALLPRAVGCQSNAQKENSFPVTCCGQACIISKLAVRNQSTTVLCIWAAGASMLVSVRSSVYAYAILDLELLSSAVLTCMQL